MKAKQLSHRFLFFGLPVIAALTSGLYGQQSLSVEAFADASQWPLYRPGDLSLRQFPEARLRSFYTFENRNPREPDASPNRTELIMDLIPAQLPAGNPTYFIQWASLGSERGASALDQLYVDRDTFQVLFRIAASGPGTFAGSYDVHLYQPEQTVRVRVGDTGEVTRKENPAAQPTFDFASFGFLFALMDLKEGKNFRLLNIGRFDDLEPGEVAVRIGGRVPLTDVNGVTHDVREVVVTNEPRSSLITFWVDDKAPYDYGWRFQLVANGTVVSEKRFQRSGP